MAIPKEPRQAMINMMYLVLTALLALNVSAEILNAFDIVNDGINNSTGIIVSKNQQVMTSFKEIATPGSPKFDQNAVAPYQSAQSASQIADEVYQEIESVKNKLKREAGLAYDKKTGDSIMTDKRDTHLPTLFMINQKHGYDVQQEIQDARNKFLNLYPDDIRKSKADELGLSADDSEVPNKGGENRDWVTYNFADVPVIAAITVLSKLQNDVRKAESDIIEYMSRSVTADILEMDKVKATMIPEKSFVTSGEAFKAQLMVTAYSSQQEPKAFKGTVDQSKLNEEGIAEVPGKFQNVPIQGTPVEMENPEGGIIEYEENASGSGERSVSGVVGIYNPKKDITTYYPFNTEYIVTQSSAVVSPTKMNVLYIGVDNPLEISVPGFQPSQIVASISQGSLPGSGGTYMAKVTNSNADADVRVAVKLKDGSTKSMGSKTFRVKRIPDPKVLFGRSSGPVISAGEAKAIPGLVPIADNFPFEVRFDIRDFDVMAKKANNPQLFTEKNEGRVFNNRVKNLIGSLRAGDRLWFDNIRVIAPDNTTRIVSLSFKII